MELRWFIKLVLLSLLSVSAAGFSSPQPTSAQDTLNSIPGISPLPTDPPFMMGWGWEEENGPRDLGRLAARQRDPGVCAYVSGLQRSSLTCVPGYSCAVIPDGIAGCCPAVSPCYLPTTCVPYTSMAYCDGDCLNNPMIFKCGNMAYPYCYTLEVDYDTTTFYQYTCWSAPGTLTAYRSYTDGSGGKTAIVEPSTVTQSALPVASPSGTGNVNNNNNENHININMGETGKPSSGAKSQAERWLGFTGVVGMLFILF